MNDENGPIGHRRDPLKQSRRPPWRERLDRAVGTFLTGLLFLLPFILTVMILDWLIRQLAAFFGTESLLGSAISGGSTLIFGERAFGVWILLSLVVALIWGVGYLFQSRAKKSIQERVDGWIDKIPLIGSIYRPISRITRMIGLRDENELSAMRPVAVRMGGRGGADVLALMPSSEPVMVGGEERVLIYMPSAPIPMTGFLTLVAKENVIEVEGLAVDDLLKFYISIGTILPEELQKIPARATPTPKP
ncbi:MAG: DUF502 domain-containing protein [Pacificimonas sp.]